MRGRHRITWRMLPMAVALLLSACAGGPATSGMSSATPSVVPAGTGSVGLGPLTVAPLAIGAAEGSRLALARLEADERARLRTQAGFPGSVGAGWSPLSSAADDAIDAGVQAFAAEFGIDVPITSGDSRLASIGAPEPFVRPAPASAASALALITAADIAGKALGKGGTQEASASATKTVTEGDDVATVTAGLKGTVTAAGSRVTADFTVDLSGDVHNAVTGATAHMSGTATAHVEIDGCPDKNGSTKGKVSMSSKESVSGQRDGVAGIAGWTRDLSGDFAVAVDDQASIAGLVFNAVAQESVQAAGDAAEAHGHELGMTAHAEFGAGPGFTGLTFEEAKSVADVTNQKNVTGADLAPLMRSVGATFSTAAIVLGKAAESFWRDGKCVEVMVDPKGGDVGPQSKTTVTAKVRHRFEGDELDKPVEASLTGLAAIDPAGTKVPAPATFTYTAGSKQGDTGKVTFKSVSNRGIGETTVTFTVNGSWVTEDNNATVGTYKGQKCGAVDGVWLVQAQINSSGLRTKITWTVTIDATKLAGTYSYKSVAVTDAGTALTTANGRASIALQADGSVIMTLEKVLATVSGSLGGQPYRVTAQIPGPTFTWTPGGTCK